jgi:hypothetical protein
MPRHPKTRRRFMIFFLRDSKPSWLVNIKGFKEHLQEVDEFYDQACFFSPCVSSRSSYRSGHHFSPYTRDKSTLFRCPKSYCWLGISH